MFTKKHVLHAFTLAIATAIATPVFAGVANFSFTGSFSQDDDVQLFNFNVGSNSTITLKTLSYAGGVNAAGTTIAAGGFDPILSLFNSTGVWIASNDDGSSPDVGYDPVTGSDWDTFLEATLSPGLYTVAVSQYDNFPVSLFLGDGFDRVGSGNFTGNEFGSASQAGLAFIDASGAQRTNAWAFDVLGVEEASVVGGTVPEPTSLAIFGILGIAGWRGCRRRNQKSRDSNIA